MGEKISRADRVKENQRIEQKKSKPRPKTQERTKEQEFNKTLEKSKLSLQLKSGPQTKSKVATERAIKEVVKQEDRRGDEKDRDEKGKDKGRDSRKEGGGQNAKLAGQKVVAKNTLKQGSGQGGKGSGFGQSLGRKGMSKVLKRAGAKTVPADLQGRFAAKLSQSLKGPDQAGQAQLSQQVLNQIVQYVKIGLNRQGEKEIQVELNEKVFRGLKLRVISREGRVAVHMRTFDSKGRRSLEKNKGAIRDALTSKGIDVDEILVS
jgi:hypothetical protein